RDAGLADARLPADEDQAPLAGYRALPFVAQGLALAFASDVGRARCGREHARDLEESSGCRCPHDFARSDRLADAAKRQRAEGLEPESFAAADEAAYEIRCDDVSAVGAVAQTLRDVDRRTEVVLLVVDRFTRVQADAHFERHGARPPVVPVDRLLHRDGT